MTQTIELEQKALSIPDQAKGLDIRDNETYQAAGEMLLTIKALRKEINATFDPIISKALAAHREALAQKKKIETPLADAEGIIKPRIAAYQDEQERIRRAEELRLRAELKKQEEEAQLAQAVATSESGDPELADQIMNETISVPQVILPKSTPKVDGISTRKIWRWRLKNIAQIDRKYLVPNDVAINAQVRALGKDAESVVGGIDVFYETVVAAGRR